MANIDIQAWLDPAHLFTVPLECSSNPKQQAFHVR